jgi:hypothetical protein
MITTEDEPVDDDEVSRIRRLARQGSRAIMQLGPDGRVALSEIPLRREDLSAVVAALSALPPSAGAAAVGAALAPFRAGESDAAVVLGAKSKRRRRVFDPGRCSFCGRARTERRCRVVSGAGVCICEDCVRSAAVALSANAADTDPVHDLVGPGRCGFCAKWSGVEARAPGRAVRLFRGPRTTICHECVALSVEIFSEDDQPSLDADARNIR